LEIGKDIPNLISVGRLIEQKSYKRLLRIHKRLVDEGLKHRLYIIGTGEQRDALQKYIKDNNLEETAYLLGFKDNPWKYESKMDMFVCSSIKEGFSTAVTEALILGLPVVTTLCSGMKEMLGESEFGLITDNDEDALYEGIKKMITDKEIYAKYKEKSVERGSFFNWEKTVKAVEELI